MPHRAARAPRTADRALGHRRAARGQGIVEYGLILGGSTVVAVVVLLFFGPTLSAVLDAIADAIDLAS